MRWRWPVGLVLALALGAVLGRAFRSAPGVQLPGPSLGAVAQAGAVAPQPIVQGGYDAGPCRVPRVIDGDTVDMKCSSFVGRVRLLRIDTPERGEPGYTEAGSPLRHMVDGRDVYLVYEQPGVREQGSYGRLLAYLFIDGRNVNVEMVRLGWSPFYTKYGEGRFPEAFRHAELEAD